MQQQQSNKHYSCFVDSRKREWNCELFDSYLEAQRHLEAYRFLEYDKNFLGKIVSLSNVWPGFIRRQLLQFQLVMPVTFKPSSSHKVSIE